MRLQQLNLIAFGPFTETVLDFSNGREGLHIVYGLNEAGKSTALRALHQMLYGIPARSNDNFMHSYSNMRIGATLRLNKGSELSFVRRKGNVNTLRAADEQTILDESELGHCLGGVPLEMFTSLFGIDHDQLVQGGRDIIQGGGSVGRVLFGAGAGITTLRVVQEEIEADLGSLFKPSAQNPSINLSISAFKKNRKALKEAELPGEEWTRHISKLNEANDRKRKVEENLSGSRGELSRLERIRTALPAIAKRIELQETFQEYAETLLLREGFTEQHQNLLNDLRVAEREKEQASKTVDEIRELLKKTVPPKRMLDKAKLIDELYRELEVHRKAARDRIQRVTQRSNARNEAMEILAELWDGIDLDAAEELRLKNTEVTLIRELGSRYEHLTAALEGARNTVRKLSSDIENIKKRITDADSPIEIDTIKSAVERAADVAPLENQYQELSKEICQARASIESGMSDQSIWRGRLDQLIKLALPSMESLSLFRERFSRLEQEAKETEAKIRTTENYLIEIEGKLGGLELEQDIPTEKDLQVAREKREDGWRLVRMSWLENTEHETDVKKYLEGFPQGSTLADAYVANVENADLLADRLRREADRVNRKIALLTEQDINSKQLELHQKQYDALLKDIEKLDKEWKSLWKPQAIEPLSPEEMIAWSRQMADLKEKESGTREKQQKATHLHESIDQHKKLLEKYLKELTLSVDTAEETLTSLVKQCRGIIAEQESIQNRLNLLLNEKKQRESDLSNAKLELETAQEALNRWHAEWGAAIQPLGLGVETTSTQANAFLDKLKELFINIKEAKGFDKRIRGIDRDAEDYAQRVTALVEATDKGLAGLPPEQAIIEINNRLADAREVRTKHQSNKKQLKQAQERLENSSNQIRVLTDQLNDLCNEAGCADIADLPEAERRSAMRHKIETELNTIDDHLRNLSAGATVEMFIKETSGVDPDTIDTQIERLKEEIEALQAQRDALQRTIWEEQAELEKMDGSAKAAELAEKGQRLLGQIDRDVEKYAKLRLASHVLNEAIERYREKNQGPLVERAGELFSALTIGSFEGIRTDFDNKGNPVLVGVRPGGRELILVDEMSDGSADQLYLALRLASIEQYIESNEPLPFIVDDILIRFDDKRSAATLKVLAELADKTQVIFFTHHLHLLELAKAHVDPNILFAQTLKA